jgi:hypothetical protein
MSCDGGGGRGPDAATTTLTFTPPDTERTATAALAAAAADRAAVAVDTAARLAELAAAEKALAPGEALRVEAAPVGTAGVTAPATVDSPGVAAVAVGLGFYVEAASMDEAAQLAARRASELQDARKGEKGV